jgi:hypothetical protein
MASVVSSSSAAQLRQRRQRRAPHRDHPQWANVHSVDTSATCPDARVQTASTRSPSRGAAAGAARLPRRAARSPTLTTALRRFSPNTRSTPTRFNAAAVRAAALRRAYASDIEPRLEREPPVVVALLLKQWLFSMLTSPLLSHSHAPRFVELAAILSAATSPIASPRRSLSCFN